MDTCHLCGSSLTRECAYCLKCGAPRRTRNYTPENTKKKKKDSPAMVAALCVGVVFFSIVLWQLYQNFGGTLQAGSASPPISSSEK